MTTKRWIYRFIGWFLLILGILGMVLPVLHGFTFFVIGLLILSKSSPWARRLLQKVETRYPKLAEQVEKWRNHPRLKRMMP
ncbi:DUF454 family protein [Desmospora profundinema]|uniref:Uncharacterized membrane protein YbaN (DUF454 family) n=1 Tax=Desmospora profundinema TaxID=1571184 RepID=A0ABU1IKQ6_9BACL|nr:DUF454 family protein [Desmospora profundinema]MDR6224988.1 uncharacterized membrane protein YbaN (DUF454 family) [Desmospora profundinema]